MGRRGGVEWIIAFLGNPGSEYENTRHNAGFMAGAAMEKLLDVKMTRLRHRALTARADIAGRGVLLMEPQTYMNLSGESVGEAARFYKVPPEHVIVVSDEMALPPGSIRIRQSGSAGGHNGIKNIIACLGTDKFKRIRVGIGAKPDRWDLADYVLAPFTPENREKIESAIKDAADALELILSGNIDEAMNRYNHKASREPKE